jgi:hypothetical protein
MSENLLEAPRTLLSRTLSAAFYVFMFAVLLLTVLAACSGPSPVYSNIVNAL